MNKSSNGVLGEELSTDALDKVNHGRHVRALDGIRGIAILLVMAQHMTGLPWEKHFDAIFGRAFAAGWVGVDLFFVLSGFLITGILFDSKGQPGKSFFGNFYARRILRIFPLFYALLFLALIVLPRIPIEKVQTALGRSTGPTWWYWAFMSNIHFALITDFPNPVLGVTWSLAVEEHFYMLWPLIVFLLNRRALAVVCVLLTLIAFGSRTYMHLSGKYNPIAIYVLTFCRMDGLAIGALLALIVRTPNWYAAIAPWGRRLFWPLLIASATLIFWNRPVWGERRVQTIGYTLFAITSACLILSAITARKGGPMARVLNSSFLVTMGKYSYGLYLLHLPIRAAIRDKVFNVEYTKPILGSQVPAQFLFFLIAGAASFGAAWLSYNLFEKHFLKLKVLFPARPTPAPSTAVATVAPAVG